MTFLFSIYEMSRKYLLPLSRCSCITSWYGDDVTCIPSITIRMCVDAIGRNMIIHCVISVFSCIGARCIGVSYRNTISKHCKLAVCQLLIVWNMLAEVSCNAKMNNFVSLYLQMPRGKNLNRSEAAKKREAEKKVHPVDREPQQARPQPKQQVCSGYLISCRYWNYFIFFCAFI